MEGTRLMLCRHGETTSNLAKTYAGQSDVLLTPAGRDQALALGRVLAGLEFDRVASSDLTRAADTQRLAVPGVEGDRLPALRERDMGALVGLTFAQVREKYPEGIPYGDYGVEDRDTMNARLRGFLRELETGPWKSVIAFAHGGVLKTVLALYPGLGLDMKARCGNCCRAVWEFTGGTWVLREWTNLEDT